MNNKDKGWVAERIYKYDQDIRAEVARQIDAALSSHRVKEHPRTTAPREPIIGACGLCGGAVVVGRAGGASAMYGERPEYHPDPHDPARCLNCGAEAAPVIPMKERRSDEREARK